MPSNGSSLSGMSSECWEGGQWNCCCNISLSRSPVTSHAEVRCTCQESWSYGLQRWQAQLFIHRKPLSHVDERVVQAFATTLTEKINSRAQACWGRSRCDLSQESKHLCESLL